MKDNEFYRLEIEKRLSAARYRHSLNVAETAVQLAGRYGADREKAYTAGLVHDILKDTPKHEQREYVVKYCGADDEILLSQPALWHSVAGAEFLKNELDMDDSDIYLAVRYHTSGRNNMSLLEKVVFIADFISADRTYPGVEDMRRYAFESLDKAIEEGLNFTIKELCLKRQPIYRDTVDAYNDAVLARFKEKKI